MSTFTPQPLKRTHCTCGAARTAHAFGTDECPTPYRPPVVGDAIRDLDSAVASGDQARVFAARGEVQRLLGHRLSECAAGGLVCAGCQSLIDSTVL